MADNIKKIITAIKKSDKKMKLLIAFALIGVFIIMLSELLPTASVKKSADNFSYEEYVEALESQTKSIVESIDGVGKCNVMLTLNCSSEYIYARNSDDNKNESSYSETREYVLYKGENGETPVLIKELYPRVEGAAVVCSGGDNIAVKEDVINCLSSLFDIPSSKISVSKLKN